MKVEMDFDYEYKYVQLVTAIMYLLGISFLGLIIGIGSIIILK